MAGACFFAAVVSARAPLPQTNPKINIITAESLFTSRSIFVYLLSVVVGLDSLTPNAQVKLRAEGMLLTAKDIKA
jgi:hypothetical protein